MSISPAAAAGGRGIAESMLKKAPLFTIVGALLFAAPSVDNLLAGAPRADGTTPRTDHLGATANDSLYLAGIAAWAAPAFAEVVPTALKAVKLLR